MDNIMFAEVNFPLLDKAKAAAEILAIPEKFSFWDEYRNTLMIPLMSKGGMLASNSILGEFFQQIPGKDNQCLSRSSVFSPKTWP